MASLHETAKDNSLNIGTADYLVGKLAPDAIKPGQLINWIKRFDTEPVNKKIEELEKLNGDPYQDAADSKKIDVLSEQWTGKGSQAFASRWDELRQYIGKDENSGNRDVLSQQLAAMKSLRDDIESLKSECRESINDHLSKVRQQYVSAMCEELDASAVDTVLADAGTGASVGSAFGPIGSGAGAAIGTVVSLVESFSISNQSRIEEIFGSDADVLNMTSALESKTNILKLAEDGYKGDSLDARKYKPDSTQYENLSDGGWDTL